MGYVMIRDTLYVKGLEYEGYGTQLDERLSEIVLQSS